MYLDFCSLPHSSLQDSTVELSSSTTRELGLPPNLPVIPLTEFPSNRKPLLDRLIPHLTLLIFTRCPSPLARAPASTSIPEKQTTARCGPGNIPSATSPAGYAIPSWGGNTWVYVHYDLNPALTTCFSILAAASPASSRLVSRTVFTHRTSHTSPTRSTRKAGSSSKESGSPRNPRASGIRGDRG